MLKEKAQVPPPSTNDGSSDEEFDVAWERRAKHKARKETVAPPAPPPPVVESPSKRSVRFAPSSEAPIEVVDLDFDGATPIESQQAKDQNNNDQQQEDLVISVIDIDDDETIVPVVETPGNSRSQITTVSQFQSERSSSKLSFSLSDFIATEKHSKQQ